MMYEDRFEENKGSGLGRERCRAAWLWLGSWELASGIACSGSKGHEQEGGAHLRGANSLSVD